MSTCQETAQVAGPVSLFLGVETFKWTIQQFVDAANFAKAHGISSLFVKVSEVGSAQDVWYGGLAGFDTIYQRLQGIVNIIPYAFVYGNTYGNLQTEISIAKQFLTKYGKYCLDMEGSFWAQGLSASWATSFNNALLPVPGTLWISCPANPGENNQLPFLQAIDQATNAMMPMAYSDYLCATYPTDFSALGCLQPTFDLSDEFGVNNVVANILNAKNAGVLAISLWEYQMGAGNTNLLDQCVNAFKGKSMHWYEYDIVVPFGNVNFDSALGGAHDLDLGCPANHPITALLSGSISSITSPAWGKQVGVALDHPINGKPYCAYLHLSAVNPTLRVGMHINVNDTIGWAGGGNTEAQYAGTRNPTGQNFLNDTFNSSRIQAGFALMNGPEYGVIGWTVFPPIDWALDPTQIILAARKGVPVSSPVAWNEYVIFLWELSKPALNAMGLNVPPRDTGIFHVWGATVGKPNFLGLVASWEIHHKDENNEDAIFQVFSGGIVKWQNNKGVIL
jgi:hypothetical protein